MWAIFWLAILGYIVLMSHLGAAITLRKGRGDSLGAALGGFLGLIGLVIALLLPSKLSPARYTGNVRDDEAIARLLRQ